MKKAIFIDRDGTLVEEVGYLKMLEDMKFTFKAREALRIFHELGFLNIVITNQSAIARGILSPRELNKIHARMKALTKEENATIDDIFFCPHYSDGRVAPYNIECDCRKPKPGMIHQAATKHALDLAGCYVVGDKPADLELACNAGVRAVLVTTGYGTQTEAEWSDPVQSFPNLFEFARSLQHTE